MYAIIDDLKILVNFLKIYNNITLEICFNYMFRNIMFRDTKNMNIFSNLFYEKYGEDIKNNILFEK